MQALALLVLLAVGSEGECDVERSIQVAKESARQQGYKVDRMAVDSAAGPTTWTAFVAVIPRYLGDYDAQRLAIGASKFYYYSLHYRSRVSHYPKKGEAGVAIVPVGGGHGVWIEASTCVVIEYLNGV